MAGSVQIRGGCAQPPHYGQKGTTPGHDGRLLRKAHQDILDERQWLVSRCSLEQILLHSSHEPFRECCQVPGGREDVEASWRCPPIRVGRPAGK